MKNTNRIYTIAEIKNMIIPIAQNYGVEKVYLFGSYARENATQNSDIDLYIHSGKISTLFALGGFYADICETLGKRVDIITSDEMSLKFRSRIQNEEILIYEQ